MSAKHTQGPFDKGRAGGIGQVFNADGRKVCDVMTNLGDLNLIAAAPELLEALEAMTEFLEPMRFDRASDNARAAKLDEQARAAIAKATGGKA